MTFRTVKSWLTAVLLLTLPAMPCQALQDPVIARNSLRGILGLWLDVVEDTGGLVSLAEVYGRVLRRLGEQGLELTGVVRADAQLIVSVSSVVVGSQGNDFLYVFVVQLRVLQRGRISRLEQAADGGRGLFTTWREAEYSFRVGDEAARSAILGSVDELVDRLLRDHALANERVP
jgi:hypothetical protein